MHKFKKVAFLVVIAGLAAGCEKSYEDKENALTEFVSENKFGYGSDYWLTSPSAVSGPIKVALIFGIDDDHELCNDIAEAMSRRDGINYSCMPAN